MNITNAAYDLTNISTSNTLYDFVKYTNDLTGQYLMMGILVVGWGILFISMKNYGNNESIISSTFIIAVISILFSSIDFVPSWFLIAIVVSFALIFGFMFNRRTS